MGYRDIKLKLSKNQAVSADANSTDYLDTELTYPGWEVGGPLGVVINVETAPGGTTGINFIICHKAGNAADPTINDTTLVTYRVPVADLVAGAEFVIPLPIGVKLLRCVRLYYDLITGDETSGVFSAFVSPIQVAGHL